MNNINWVYISFFYYKGFDFKSTEGKHREVTSMGFKLLWHDDDFTEEKWLHGDECQGIVESGWNLKLRGGVGDVEIWRVA